MNKLVKKVSKDNLYIEYLKAMNGILHLTDREMEIMNRLINIDLNYNQSSEEPKNIVSTEYRKKLREELKLSPENLSRYITRFCRDGFLIKKRDGSVTVNRALIPEIIRDRIQVAVILYVTD